MPLIIGMYEGQDGAPSLAFMKDAGAYMKTFTYGKSLLSVTPSQMRTIPIAKSLTAEHHVAPFDEIHTIVTEAKGPFVVLNCICRSGAKLRRKPCSKTSRTETCLAMGNMASMVLERKHGRELAREEALAILTQNEEEGLVFQPAGVQNPEFICSCCGCCCGMLGMQKKLPRPVDFSASSFQAEVSEANCTACKRCVGRCQMDAITVLAGAKAKVNLARCIGCGLCVSTCAPKALRLIKKASPPNLPQDEEALLEEIKKNKKSPLGEWWMVAKVALGMKQ